MDAAQVEIASLKAEILSLRSSSVHVEIVKDLLDNIKSMKDETKMFFDFLRSTGQVQEYESWKQTYSHVGG